MFFFENTSHQSFYDLILGKNTSEKEPVSSSVFSVLFLKKVWNMQLSKNSILPQLKSAFHDSW